MLKFVGDELMVEFAQIAGIINVAGIIFLQRLFDGERFVDDLAENPKRRVLFGEILSFAADAGAVNQEFDDIFRVALIHDGKAGRKVDRLAVAPQRDVGERMERAAGDFFTAGIQQG